MSWVEPELYQLTIEDVLLHVPGCWTVLNPQILRKAAPNKVSNSSTLGRSGMAPRPVFIDEATHKLQLLVAGENNREGDPFDDQIEGLASNLADLQNLIVNAPGDDFDGILQASLAAPNGTYTGAVQVKDYDEGDGIFDCPVVLTLVVPGGRLQPAGS